MKLIEELSLHEFFFSKLTRPEELTLKLTENGKPTDPEEDWGTIQLCVTLIPKTQQEREQVSCIWHGFVFRRDFGPKLSSNLLFPLLQFYSKDYHKDSKKQKIQEWDSVVNIVLIEARNLPAKDSNGLCDPYVRFRLGNEKYKSRVVFRNRDPVYYEQFDLHTYPTQTKVLEISVYDNNSFSDEFIGKNAINLNCLNKEETHELIVKLDGLESAELLLLLTISGIKHTDEPNNNSDYNFLEQSYVGDDERPA